MSLCSSANSVANDIAFTPGIQIVSRLSRYKLEGIHLTVNSVNGLPEKRLSDRNEKLIEVDYTQMECPTRRSSRSREFQA